jgi:phosphoribosylamine--glycine ligase
MQTYPLKDFTNMDEAACFIKSNPGAWVVKPNEDNSQNIGYVGELETGEDTLGIISNYLQNKFINRGQRITLHKRVRGVEIGVGRYFNGKDWVGPIEINLEHKKFFPGDIGPLTSEMGTLAWYDENENNKLFQETLAKLKPHLEEINFKD